MAASSAADRRRRAALAAVGARLREPSTWAALGALGALAGAQLPEGFAQHAATLAGLIGAAAGVFIPERAGPPEPPPQDRG